MSLEGRKVAIAVAFALGVQTMPAQAQVGAAPGAQIEEIKVTARKIEERLQDVPIAVSVVDESLIERTVSRSVYDVARMVPNLGFNQTYGRAFDRPAMRGQGSVIGDRTVGLFVDGIYVPGSISSTDLSNVARVEVLRGPQTALFGRGTLSGAINYVTKRPSAKTEGRADVTVGDHGLLDASASVSGPITDDGALRYYVGISSHDFGGYYTNTGFDGGDVGVEHTTAGSASLYWQPAENFDAVLRTSYSKDNDGIWALSLLKTLNCFTTNPGARGGYYCGEVPVIPTNGVQTDFNPGGIADPGTNKLTRRTALDMRYRFSDMELTSITAYTNEDERWAYDDGQQNLQVTATGAPAPYRYNGPNPGFLSMITRNWRSTSQEFHLSSDTQQRLRWMVGAFGYWETFDSTTGNPTVTNGVIGPVPVNPRKETENLALFGRIEYDFAAAWTGTLEGRAARDTFKYGLPTGEQERDFQSNTPRVSLTWKATEATTFYASYAQGTRPGDMNTNLFNAAVPPAERERLSGYVEIEEETADNYELGVKSWLFDRRVYAELAIFDIEWDKQQLTVSETYRNASNTLTPISLVVNAGKTRVKGLEFSFAWNVTDSLAFSGSYGLADAKFKEFCDINQIPLTGTCSVEGNHPPNTPKNTGALSLVHHLPVAGGEVQTSVDYSYQGTRYDQVGNYAETGSSERLGARIAFEHENFSVAVWGKNLTDDRSADSIVRFVNFDAPTVSNRAFQVRYPNGRTWGMSFGVKF